MNKDKGKKKDAGVGVAVMSERMPPMLHLDGDDAMDGLSMGDAVTLTVKAKLVGDSIDTYGEKDRRSQRFEVTNIERSGRNSMAERAQRKGRGIRGGD